MRMRLVSLTSLLAALGVPSTNANDGGGGSAEDLRTFAALSVPTGLFPGQISNSIRRLKIPPGPIAISELAVDVVELDPRTGDVVPVPLSEAYLHHIVWFSEHGAGDGDGNADGDGDGRRKLSGRTIGPLDLELGLGSTRGVGFGAGTESRGTPQKFPYPFRFTTVAGEDSLVVNVHLINTRGMTAQQAGRCVECPCTAQQDYAFKDGVETSTLSKSVLDHKEVHSKWGWDGCNAALVEEENDSCFPDKYRGGIHCCRPEEFCLDDYFMTEKKKKNKFYIRYNLTYAPPTPEVRPLVLASCCDASGDETRSGNFEYDIPKCAADGDDCVHELETVQALHGPAHDEEDAYVDVVRMVGHLHRGGLSVSAHLMDGTPLCVSLPTYGTGAPGEIGNEPGYITSMSSCTFDPPLRMKTTDRIRVVGRYSAKVARTGVMSLIYIAIADAAETARESQAAETAQESQAAETAQESQEPKKLFGSFAISLAFVLGCALVTAHSSLAARPTPMVSTEKATRSAEDDDKETRSLVAPG